MSILLFFMGFLFGAVLGSFSNALIYRVPLGISFVGSWKTGAEHSCCPHCQQRLSWKDLIPIISWLCVRGQCRYCHIEIGKSYIILECMMAVLGGAVLMFLGLSALTLYIFLMMPFFISFCVIFFRYKDFSMLESLSFTMVGISITILVMLYFLPTLL